MPQKQKPVDNIWDEITVVIVTYNSAKVVGGCLKPLMEATKIVVVDNASNDQTCEVVRQISPDIEIIKNTKNTGFGAGINQGMSCVETTYGFAINPDAVVQPGALEELARKAEASPDAAILCPFLHDANGRVELPVMGPHEIYHYPMVTEPAGDFCTWFMTGAALLYRTRAWQDVGGYDETIFLYNEDADLALRTSAKGYSMIIVPTAVVVHSGGGSSAPSPHVVRLKNWHMTWSHLYLTGKHLDKGLARREALVKAIRFGLRTLMYWLVFRVDKATREEARFSACYSYLFKPASIARQMGEQ